MLVHFPAQYSSFTCQCFLDSHPRVWDSSSPDTSASPRACSPPVLPGFTILPFLPICTHALLNVRNSHSILFLTRPTTPVLLLSLPFRLGAPAVCSHSTNSDQSARLLVVNFFFLISLSRDCFISFYLVCFTMPYTKQHYLMQNKWTSVVSHL